MYALHREVEKLNASENPELTLLAHKQDIERLKEEYLTNIAWKQFLNYCREGGNYESKLITNREFNKEKLKESQLKLRNEKDTLREAEENVEKLIIEDSEKIKRVEDLTRMIEERENSINKVASILANLEEQENKWIEARDTEAKLEAEERELDAEIARFKLNIKRKGNKKQGKLREDKEKKVEDIQQKNSQLRCQESDEDSCWKVSLERRLACLSFIHDVQFDEEKMSMSLEISSSSAEFVPVELTVFYRKNEEQNLYVIDRAETSLEGLLPLDEIVEAVRDSNNVATLVSEVKKAYLQQLGVSREIEELRKKYAMDWLANEGLVRVMLGGSGQVVCTLSIKRSYPSPGSVQLVKIEGIQLGDIDDAQLQFQCKGAKPSITWWFENLKNFVQDKL